MDERFSIGNATLHQILKLYLKDIPANTPVEERPTETQLLQRLEETKAAGIGFDGLWTLNIPLALRAAKGLTEEASAIFCQAVALEEICHAFGRVQHDKQECGHFIDHLRYVLLVAEY